MGSEQVRRSAPVLLYAVFAIGLVLFLAFAPSVDARPLTNDKEVTPNDSEDTVAEASLVEEEMNFVNDEFCVPKPNETADEIFERCFARDRMLGDYSPPGPNHNTHPPGH